LGYRAGLSRTLAATGDWLYSMLPPQTKLYCVRIFIWVLLTLLPETEGVVGG